MKKFILPLCVLFIMSSCAINPALLENPALFAKHYDAFRVVAIKFEYLNKDPSSYPAMDFLSDPDVAIAMYDKDGQLVLRTSTIQDVTFSQYPIAWGESERMLKNNEPYYLKILDEDLTGYEIMGETEIKVIDCYQEKQQVSFQTKGGNLITLLLKPY